ncbi:MAG: hypothetical protein HRU20_17880 [Pseudomonadales bacterium]|nr:hypothetical protein [Pseudomonadales bacterium]
MLPLFPFKKMALAITLASGSFSAFSADITPFDLLGDVKGELGIISPFVKPAPELGPTAKMAPALIELNLEGLGLVQLQLDETFNQLGRQILKGRLLQGGAEIPFSEVILVESHNDTIMASIETPENKWLIMPDINNQQQYLIKRESPAMDDDIIEDPEHAKLEKTLLGIGMAPEEIPRAAPDIDGNGDTVIDIFMGFSEKALPYVQDKDAYALMQIATVNNALENSKIDNIRVRLVGTGTTDQHMGMSSYQLPLLKDWFADDINKYSPDVVTGFMIWDETFENQATGWGYVNGYYNINDIKSPNAFRHELGHNIGGSHCNNNAAYNFGYNNGMTKTHQCGNNINYYSNPDVTDMYGLAIGDPNTGNMAKIWRDNASRHSAFRPAVVPFEEEERSLLAHKTGINVGNGQWAYVNVNIPEGASRIVVLLNDSDQSQGGASRLYIQQGSNPTANSYHTASAATAPYYVNNHALAVNNVSAGNWVVGINGIKDQAKNLQLKVYSYDSSGNIVDGGGNDQNDDNQQADDGELLAEITSPANGSQLDNASMTFEHGDKQNMWLYVGSSAGGSDVFNQQISGTSTRVEGLPEDGSDIFVTLWTMIDGDWQSQNYGYSSVTNQQQVDETESTNTIPQAHLQAPLSVQTPATGVTLDGTASMDVDGDNLTYIWFQLSGPTVNLNKQNTSLTTFSVDALDSDTTAQFRLTVFDGKDTHSSDVSILLKATNNDGGAADNDNEDYEQTDNETDNNTDTDIDAGGDESLGDNVDDVQDEQDNTNAEASSGSTAWLMLGLLGLFGQISRSKKTIK